MSRAEQCEKTLVELETAPTSANTHPTLGERPGTIPAQPATSLSGRSKVARAELAAGKIAVAIEPAALCAIFGVADAQVATRLLSQLVSILQPSPDKRRSKEAMVQRKSIRALLREAQQLLKTDK